jgi:fibronectin type 3 domain-containing protein
VADTTKSASANVTVSAPVQHTVTLAWTASTSAVSGYNVYRGTVSGGPYTKVNSVLEAATSYVDNTVQSGTTYFYVVTSQDSNGVESAFSNQVQAVVPIP